MRKSITARYFYSTALLLLCSITVMGFIQIYLSMGYFQTEKTMSLIAAIDNVTEILQEHKTEDRVLYETQEMPGVTREVRIAARAAGVLMFITDPSGTAILTGAENQDGVLGLQVPQKVLDATLAKGSYAELGTLGGFMALRAYVAGRALLTSSGELAGFIFAATDASALWEYTSNMLSTFILSAGLMLMVSSVLSIVLTARMTTPLLRIAGAANRFGKGDFSVRVPVEGDDEMTQLSTNFNAMAESLQKIDSSRSSFMGNIAHELRTPMTTIKGFVDGIIDGTIPPESQQHYLGIVSQEVARLTRLIKNMLDITKLEAGEYTVNSKTYDIWESITGVVFGAQQRIEANHIQIIGFAPSRTMVYADCDLVYQVVYNLFDNALKFCGEGGEIRLSVTCSKNSVTVSIRNSGAGIDPESLPYVFDRFYKEDKSRGLNTAGSGLGLHICKVLINLCGGDIWAQSKQDEYCQFSFTLPCPPTGPKAIPPLKEATD